MKQLITTLLTIVVGVVYFLFDFFGSSTSGSMDVGSNELVIKFLDVGQGDATLIKTATETVLVDTGDVEERDKTIKALRAAGVTRLDKIILTHPHADHIGGMKAIIDEFEVAKVYDNGMPTGSKIYLGYMKQLKDKNIPVQALTAGETLEIGDRAELNVFYPTKELIEKGQAKSYKHNPNNESVVMKLNYKDFSLMLTGDAEREVESYLVERCGSRLKSTILKAGHHGSKTSSTADFLRAVEPKATIISCGANNDYGHPHKETLKKFNLLKLDIYDTPTNGTVTLVTDGINYQFSTERN